MNEKVDTVMFFADMAWSRFDAAVKDLPEKEIEWRPVPEGNNIRWILTHISWEWNVRVQQVLRADPSYMPERWPEDYVVNTSYSLQKIMDDISEAKGKDIKSICELKQEDLEEEIPLWGTTKKRGFGISNYVSELMHHTGQIAYLRGDIKRRRLVDPSFLK